MNIDLDPLRADIILRIVALKEHVLPPWLAPFSREPSDDG